MFKNISIGQKIHIPIISFMLFGILLIILNSFYSLHKTTQDSYKVYTQNMKDDVEQGLNEKKQIGLTSVIAISQNRDIIHALKNKDRKLAFTTLEKLATTYKASTEYQNIKIHIHTKDTKSFLRHWNKEVYDDDLSSFRDSLLQVKKERKPFITIESGRAGMVLRGIAPIFDGDMYLGSVEFMQGFNSLIKKYKKLKNYDLLFLELEDQRKIKRFDANQLRLHEYILSQKIENSNKKLIESLHKNNHPIVEGFFTLNNFFITTLAIKNYNNVKVGDVLIAADLSAVNSFIDASRQSLLEQLYILILLDIILLLSVIFIMNKYVKKPIENLVQDISEIDSNLHVKGLKTLFADNKLTITSNDEVGSIQTVVNSLLQQLTKNFNKLEKSKKYTTEYLKAVDAGSIVSKSNLRGMITYVNDTLCDKTGYSREELLGKPHSIFRHSHTPKSVFREMWQTIQAGKIYHGLFKNKRKDGSAFYANITIVPIKNKNNKIIEYVALRDDVTELVNSKEELKRTFYTDSFTRYGKKELLPSGDRYPPISRSKRLLWL